MPKLVPSPSSLKPRCGEIIKVRVDTDPPHGQIPIDSLPDNGAVTVKPPTGTTNADGYTYFEIACENRGGNCEEATVTFKANGHDSCSVTVNCHSYTSTSLAPPTNQIENIILSLAETQGRLALMARSGGQRSEKNPCSESAFADWATELFSELVSAEDHSHAPIIAYSSMDRQKLFVLEGRREKALRALGIRAQNPKKIVIPGLRESLAIEEILGPINVLEDEVPKPGAVRVREDRKCGKVSPLRQGECRKLKDDLYVRAVHFARALCHPAPNETCTEKYIPYAEVRCYRKPGCEDFIEKVSLYGWLCAGGPPHYY